jgi:rSAM/selenodomain-associated transferase 1
MNALGLFVKQPVPGRVKTRLAADLGAERAAELYAAFVTDLADRYRTTADRRILGFTPNNTPAREHFDHLAQTDFTLWPQPDVSLGERMQAFFASQFDAGAERVVLIGSDSPSLPVAIVEDAFEQLAEADVVLGPATDGGYYLIGQRRLVGQSQASRPIFDDIDWSESRVLMQTVERVAGCNASLSLLTPWYDIDTQDDLALLRGHLAAIKQAGMPLGLPHVTRALKVED